MTTCHALRHWHYVLIVRCAKVGQRVIDALQMYQAQSTPSNHTTTVDLATIEDTRDEPVPIIDAILRDLDATV